MLSSAAVGNGCREIAEALVPFLQEKQAFRHGCCCRVSAPCAQEHLSFVQNYGWEAYFAALGTACGMALLLLAPMVNLKSYVQREEAAQLKAA